MNEVKFTEYMESFDRFGKLVTKTKKASIDFLFKVGFLKKNKKNEIITYK
jgi:hypothetical protein